MDHLERLIGTLGFPIVVAGYLLWFQLNLMREVRDHLAAILELMKQQASALEQLTAALRTLVEKGRE